ncbi:hypothetical protein B0H11DRAFT_1926007 [Mycena galericulata]|nr:hypothetical protein B0H11DRAFT_1926007 [Mycena galericulata]
MSSVLPAITARPLKTPLPLLDLSPAHVGLSQMYCRSGLSRLSRSKMNKVKWIQWIERFNKLSRLSACGGRAQARMDEIRHAHSNAKDGTLPEVRHLHVNQRHFFLSGTAHISKCAALEINSAELETKHGTLDWYNVCRRSAPAP